MRAIVQRYHDGLGWEEKVVYKEGLVKGFPVEVASTHEIISGDIDLEPDLMVVGSVEAVTSVLSKLGVTPPQPDYYPDALRDQLHRHIRRTTLENALRMADASPVFVKSCAWKVLSGQVLLDRASSVAAIGKAIGIDSQKELPLDLPVWVSRPVHFLAEYRVYALDGKVLGVSLYKGDESLDDLPPVIDMYVVRKGVSRLFERNDSRATVLDYGLLSDGRTALVEKNDAWSIGLYPGIADNDYVKMLWARWQEMVVSAFAQ